MGILDRFKAARDAVRARNNVEFLAPIREGITPALIEGCGELGAAIDLLSNSLVDWDELQSGSLLEAIQASTPALEQLQATIAKHLAIVKAQRAALAAKDSEDVN